jgi:mRNA interferase MazF
MKAKPGEIWLADLGLAAKVRPILIVSRNDPDPPRSLVLYVPLTRQNRGSSYEVELGQLRFLNDLSYANVQGLGSLPTVRLERFLGKIPPDLFARVKVAISFAMEL